MNKKVFVTRPIPEVGLSMLREKGFEVDVSGWKIPPTKEEILSALTGTSFDAVITLLTDKIDEDILKAAPSVKIYSNFAVGFDNIDIKAATRHSVIVTNTPGTFSHCIAEHAVALMLALSTRLVEGDGFLRRGEYKGWDPMIFIGGDTCNKTLGLLGAGKIGELVAKQCARGFDMPVIYYDVKRNPTIEKEYGAVFMENLDDVIHQADFLSIHVPLLDSTHHLINEERLNMMKPTAYLINTSRGPVVDEVALVKALQEKKIAGAGLDVFEFEPYITEGLTSLSNVVLTPHIASARESARNEMSTLAAENIIDFFENRNPKNKVN